MYPEIEDGRSKSVTALIGSPGLRVYCDLRTAQSDLTGNIRGLHMTSTGRCYAVCRQTLFEIKRDGSAIKIGDIETPSGPVGMADNGEAVALLNGTGIEGDQLFVTDGKNGHVWQMSTGIQLSMSSVYKQIKGTSVVFMNGRFIVNRPDTGQFYYSGLYNGTSWGGDDYYTAEGSPDNLISIKKTNNELWLIGELTTEVWYDTGSVDGAGKPVFRRIQGAFIDIGTVASNSVASIGSSIFWIGSNTRGIGSVWMNSGLNPLRISTHAIEQLISKMPKISDAIGYCYQQEGHQFYVLNFLTANKTFVFDNLTGQWHQRAYYDENANILLSHRVIAAGSVFDTVLCGDHSDPLVYEFRLDKYTDNGAKILRRRTFPHVASQQNYVFFHELEVEMEKGSSSVTETYDDPVASGVNDDFESYDLGIFDSSSGVVWDVYKKSALSGDLRIIMD